MSAVVGGLWIGTQTPALAQDFFGYGNPPDTRTPFHRNIFRPIPDTQGTILLRRPMIHPMVGTIILAIPTEVIPMFPTFKAIIPIMVPAAMAVRGTMAAIIQAIIRARYIMAYRETSKPTPLQPALGPMGSSRGYAGAPSGGAQLPPTQEGGAQPRPGAGGNPVRNPTGTRGGRNGAAPPPHDVSPSTQRTPPPAPRYIAPAAQHEASPPMSRMRMR